MPKFKPNWPLLAGLRYLLAVTVCLYHSASVIRDGTADYYSCLGPSAAVAIFFVISGISMRHSFEGEPAGFLRRRFWRIAPLYWVGCIGSFLPFLIWGSPYRVMVSLSEFISLDMAPFRYFAIKFVGLYPLLFHAKSEAFNGALWSVGVESAFYLAVPVMSRLPRRYLWCAVIASAILRAFIYPKHSAWSLYAGEFCYFGLGWMVMDYHRKTWFIAAGAVITAATAVVVIGLRGETFGPVLALLGWVILMFSDRVQVPEKYRKGLSYLGDLSFPLYVLNMPFCFCILPLSLPILYTAPILVVAYASVIAAVLLHTIDRPLRRFGREPLLRRRPALEPVLAEAG